MIIFECNLEKTCYHSYDNQLYLDAVAVKTLEVVESASGSSKDSLFGVLNMTSTPMGERLLKTRLLNPIRDLDEISRRQEWIQFFVMNAELIGKLEPILSEIYDLERIITRVTAGRSSPRDLVWLKQSIANLPVLKSVLSEYHHAYCNEFLEDFDTLIDIFDLIDKSIVDDPPLTVTEGGIIKKGYLQDIDELTSIKKHSQELLLKIENEEKIKTGISTLKVRYNKVFGYYIEISKGQLNKVPEYYERRQTLVNAERFITPELKELEEKILTAEESLAKIEYEVFNNVREQVAHCR